MEETMITSQRKIKTDKKKKNNSDNESGTDDSGEETETKPVAPDKWATDVSERIK